MTKGFFQGEFSRLGLGTHLGDVTPEFCQKQQEAIRYALCHGMNIVDTAINYRGNLAEKDVGVALAELFRTGKCRREDVCVVSKAGLLFGDITEKRNPKKYFEEVLEPAGVAWSDYAEADGLYQTLNPKHFEIAFEKSLRNLQLETLDVHYIHIPEITFANCANDSFYQQLEDLFAWYEGKIAAGKLRSYGLALEFTTMEPEEPKWNFSLEKIVELARKAGDGFRFVQLPYSIFYPGAFTHKTQTVAGQSFSMIEACHALGLTVVGSMPYAMGDGFTRRTASEMLQFALDGVDIVNVGSSSIEHISEALNLLT
ncbi:MAG: aldo/keto reductase [Lachnospiraceae bacterium]|nr:aldo/keto reductase [Lachnospiraceae bacterium]